jgi:hypothetical protein
MKELLQAFEAHLISNAGYYVTVLGTTISVLTIAAICTMPEKCPLIRENHPVQELWKWLRDTVQTAVPASRHKNP